MKIGVTERGDAGLDLSWAKNLQDANIIITKNPTGKHFQKLIIKNNNRIILHVGCTGWGGTMVEPNVPDKQVVLDAVHKLIADGFPVQQIVLRVDPIWPTGNGIMRMNNVLELFRKTGIQRVRFSLLDMYPHVKVRLQKYFKEHYGFEKSLPYESFHAPAELQRLVYDRLIKWLNVYELEACAEKVPAKYKKDINLIGCISQRDLSILNITPEKQDKPTGYQRPLCSCLGGKTELLKNKKQCPHNCIYCYWKVDNK